eukprot:Gb_17431 [translate_table: standard]
MAFTFVQNHGAEFSVEAMGGSGKLDQGGEELLSYHSLTNFYGFVSSSDDAPIPRRTSPQQLTIFYDGFVHVYAATPQEVNAIMAIAGKNDGPQTNVVTHPATCSSPSSSAEQIMKTMGIANIRPLLLHAHIPKLHAELPISRKLSIQRFLHKRKERLRTASPYKTPTQTDNSPVSSIAEN